MREADKNQENLLFTAVIYSVVRSVAEKLKPWLKILFITWASLFLAPDVGLGPENIHVSSESLQKLPGFSEVSVSGSVGLVL